MMHNDARVNPILAVQVPDQVDRARGGQLQQVQHQERRLELRHPPDRARHLRPHPLSR